MKPLEFFQKNEQKIAGWRHHLHANPELLFEVQNTAAFVANKLREFGVDEVVEDVGKTGVVGVIHGSRPGNNKSIGLRADMDALPIKEATNLAYASTNSGVMHACGHDGHTAMLLGAASYLAEHKDFSGHIVLIFQPAEEGGGGAKAMLDDGLVHRFGLAEVYGLHNRPGLPVGKFASRPAELMASGDIFKIEITAKGGHAARPHHCVDPLIVASHLHIALQTIVSRTLDPTESVVVSVTQIHGGDADNVIPQTAVLRGTVRALSEDARQTALGRLRSISELTAKTFMAEAEVEIESVVPPTINHPEFAEHAATSARAVAGADNVDMNFHLNMGGEDFAFLLQEIPGAHMFIGQGDTVGLHHPQFDFNDDIIVQGCQYWVDLALSRCAASEE